MDMILKADSADHAEVPLVIRSLDGRTRALVRPGMVDPHMLLQALPLAIYIVDAAGRITFYNDAAAALWGCRPELGKSEWCGSWRLYWPDGRPMPHDECPMAIALKEKRAISGAEAVAERPDGTRIRFLAYPTPLWDESGVLVGAVNTLVDITKSMADEYYERRFEAVVTSSGDAIICKDLDGIITMWNPGANRLFGYASSEVIGKPITILIPADRRDEEIGILNCIRQGGRVDHYDTVRQRKDGSLVEISLTVSPIKNSDGAIVGASKIARDITERRRAEEQQRLLLREMNHRFKNLFALVGGLITLSGRSATTPNELAAAVRERLDALGRAHQLTLPDLNGGTEGQDRATSLPTLIRTILAPYFMQDHVPATIAGPDVPVSGSAVTSVALLLHEIAANAAKYGALSSPSGHVDVSWLVWKEELLLTWRERGGPPVSGEPASEGFGSLLTRLTVGQLAGSITRDWNTEGLNLNLSLPIERLSR